MSNTRTKVYEQVVIINDALIAILTELRDNPSGFDPMDVENLKMLREDIKLLLKVDREKKHLTQCGFIVSGSKGEEP